MTDSAGAIRREDIRMREGENGPVLDIDGLELSFQVAYRDGSKGFDSKAEPVSTELDSNGDISYWIVYPEDDAAEYIEIVPEAVSDE